MGSLMSKQYKKRTKVAKRMKLFSCPAYIRIKRALTFKELDSAYRLVYNIFLNCGYTDFSETGRRIRIWEMLPHMATFYAEDTRSGKVVGVTSVINSCAPYYSPCIDIFPEELELMINRYSSVWEYTNLAVLPEYRGKGVITELARCCYSHISNFRGNLLIAEICPSHSLLFEILLFEFYSRGLYHGDIVEGIRLDLQNASELYKTVDSELGENKFLYSFFLSDNPYFKLTKEWEYKADTMWNRDSIGKKLHNLHNPSAYSCSEI